MTDQLRPVHTPQHAFAIPAFAQNRLTPTSDAATTTAQSLLAEHGDCKAYGAAGYIPKMGFNKRKMEMPAGKKPRTKRPPVARPIARFSRTPSSW
jgi:hypothetical protein